MKLRKGQVVDVLSAEAIAASGSVESSIIDVSLMEDYNFSLQFVITSTADNATATVEAYLSNNSKDFPKKVTVASGQTRTSGPSSDGKVMALIETGLPCASMKIKVTETGAATGLTISAWLMGS